MFQSVRSFPITQAVVIGAVALPVIAAGVYVVLRIRRKPKDKEKLRRLEVNSTGRLADATIADINDDVIVYEYSVAGLTYTAAQDISQLREMIPADSYRLIGRAASMKYSSHNPANSILLCEEWSGLHPVPAIQTSKVVSQPSSVPSQPSAVASQHEMPAPLE